MPKISLNSIDYEVVSFERDGVVQVVHTEPIEPFAEAFSTTGQTTQERITQHDSRNFPPPIEGIGKDKILAHDEGDPDSYKFFFDSDGVDTRWPSIYTLPREREDVTITGLERIFASAEFNGELRGLWTDDDASPDLMSVTYATTPAWLESNGSEIVDGASVALTGLDATTFTDKMVVLYASDTDHIIEHSTDGVTWTAASPGTTSNLFANAVTDNEDIDGGIFVTIAGLLTAVIWSEAAGEIIFFTSADAAVWAVQTSALSIPSSGGVKGAVVVRGPDRNDHIIVGTKEGLWDVDVSDGSGSWTTRQIEALPAHDDNCRRMAVHNGKVWFPQGVGTSEPFQMFVLSVVDGEWDIAPSRNSPHLMDGLTSTKLGTVQYVRSSGGFVYISVGGGAASRQATIMCHNGLGWHVVVFHPTANRKFTWFAISGESDGVTRLHYVARASSTSSTAHQISLPNTNPAAGVSHTYEQVGTLERPTTDMGMPFINKAIVQYQSNAGSLSSTNADKHIELFDALDGEARGTNDRGDFVSLDTDLVIAAGAGVSSKSITIREVLRNASENTSTPEGVSVEVDFVARPRDLERFFVRIDVEATADLEKLNTETVYSNINTAKISVPLVPFTYMNIGTKYVHAKPFKGEVFESEASTDTISNRVGTIDLVLEEKVV